MSFKEAKTKLLLIPGTKLRALHVQGNVQDINHFFVYNTVQ